MLGLPFRLCCPPGRDQDHPQDAHTRHDAADLSPEHAVDAQAPAHHRDECALLLPRRDLSLSDAVSSAVEWFESKGHIYIVFELAAGGELFDHLIESPNYRFVSCCSSLKLPSLS